MTSKTGSRMLLTSAVVFAAWVYFGASLTHSTAQRKSGATRSSTTTTRTDSSATRKAGSGTASSGTRNGGTASRTTTTTTTRSATATGTRNAGVVAGEEGYAAVTRSGNVVVANEEGVAAKGRYGNVVVGESYESHDAWRAAAGVATGIAIGTMLANPPTAATTVVVGGTTYWVYQNAYYKRVYVGGVVNYQVVDRPL
jgi:hypothetical protein